jgi:Chromo (CHRromatin Organisation MOdifier) domain
VASIFLDNVYKLHGLPSSIVSDRDPIFTSKFWQELLKLLGVKLNMSTAYHPQSDGQTEHVNQCLENYLRGMLPLAQWWYNTNFHRSIQMTPFQALYGYPPPQLPLGHPPKSSVEAVDSLLRTRHRQLTQLRANLTIAQDRMKKFVDTHRTERSFAIGDWVYIKLQPYRQLTVSKRHNHKLGPRYYGPYEIEDRIGTVAYRLRLLVGSTIHSVLHVSQLKKHIGRDQPVSPTLPLLNSNGQLQIYPEAILARRAIKRDNTAIPQLLIKWSNLSEDDASWEDYSVIRNVYPDVILEDKNVFEDGGVSDTATIELIDGTREKEQRAGNKRNRSSGSRRGQNLNKNRTADRWAPYLKEMTEGAVSLWTEDEPMIN